MTTTTTPTDRISLRRNVITIATAVVGAVLLWWLESGPLRVDLSVATGATTQQVTAVSVLIVALLAGAAGTATSRILVRTTPRRARTTWTILASAVLVISLLGPLGATSTAATVALVALHLVVGLTLVIGLRPGRGYGE